MKKTVVGIAFFLMAFLFGACATQFNLQKKCSQLEEHKADGSNVMTDNYVCE